MEKDHVARHRGAKHRCAICQESLCVFEQITVASHGIPEIVREVSKEIVA